MPEYLTVTWKTAPIGRLDIFRLSYSTLDPSRATYSPRGNDLVIFIDNIWQDTLNFDSFVGGLQTVYLTEICCMNYHKPKLRDVNGKNYLKFTDVLCEKSKKTGNECVFLKMANIIHNSNYVINNG